MKTAMSTRVTVLFSALFAFALALAFAPAAFAANMQLNAPTTVSDDITRLHVNKLDKSTHEFVKGATMAIINEQTGEIVDSWVTSDGTHENEKGLDVNVVYILRELEAPAGYSKVQDVRFIVNETEGTGITVLDMGDDAEQVESYKLALYDARATAEEEIVVTQQTSANPTSNTANTNANGGTTTNAPSSHSSKAVAPKTGDEAPMNLVAGLCAVGALLIVALQISKRRYRDELDY
jgi:hypothetical protein